MAIQNKRILLILAVAFTLLLIPFVAMQFSDAMDWKFKDFVIMGFLLLGTGLLFELVFRKVESFKKRLLLCLIILFVLLLIWLELAVGIVGTVFAGQ